MAKINKKKVKKFLKGLDKVKKKKSKSDKSKKKLATQIDKIKKVTSKKKVSKISVDKELIKLEGLISDVIEKEKSILTTENMRTQLAKNVRNRVTELTKKIDDIEEMRNEEYQDSKQSVRKLQSTVNQLSTKFDAYTKAKNERDKRMMELEEKIKDKVDDNLQEVLKVEEQIRKLEKIYIKLKAEGETPPEQMEQIGKKISTLKQDAHEKRVAAIVGEKPKKKEELLLDEKPTFKPERALPKLPKLPELPKFLKKEEKHKEKVKEKKKDKLPELPPLPPLPPKDSIMEKEELPPAPKPITPMYTEKKVGIVDWFKNLFKKKEPKEIPPPKPLPKLDLPPLKSEMKKEDKKVKKERELPPLPKLDEDLFKSPKFKFRKTETPPEHVDTKPGEKGSFLNLYRKKKVKYK
ncbi:hypothetical protein ACFL1H_02570 [Nanoarchaeota archaeon]